MCNVINCASGGRKKNNMENNIHNANLCLIEHCRKNKDFEKEQCKNSVEAIRLVELMLLYAQQCDNNILCKPFKID